MSESQRGGAVTRGGAGRGLGSLDCTAKLVHEEAHVLVHEVLRRPDDLKQVRVDLCANRNVSYVLCQAGRIVFLACRPALRGLPPHLRPLEIIGWYPVSLVIPRSRLLALSSARPSASRLTIEAPARSAHPHSLARVSTPDARPHSVLQRGMRFPQGGSGARVLTALRPQSAASRRPVERAVQQ